MSSMCKVMENIRAEERAEGRAEERVEGEINMLVFAVTSLMENMKITGSAAMDILSVPEEKRGCVLNCLSQ